MRASVVVLATVLVASIALGLTQAISVEPRTAAWSGWTRTVEPNDRVSQIITCNFDSLGHPGYVELFAGDACAEKPGTLGLLKNRASTAVRRR